MSARRRSDSTATLIGAGVAGAAGLAVVLGLAPTAGAAPASTDAPTAQAPEKVQPKVAPESGSETSSPDVEPNYGAQKIRVGVQQKDGSYVPPGSTTAGTKITLTQTVPRPRRRSSRSA